jgi:xylulokinase
MNTKDLILGIDIGTTGTKCTFYRIDGSQAASAYTEYTAVIPQPGWSEQDPERWWHAVKDNLRRCFCDQKIESSRVLVISLSCTNAMTLVGTDGMPLYNAITLHDKRADPQLQWLREHVGEDRVQSVCCNRLDKGTFCLPNLRWLIDNKPELVRNAKCFLMPSGYIIHKLTDRFSINESRLDLTSIGDFRSHGWNLDLCRLAQVPQRLLPEVYHSTDIVGEVTSAAAAVTGLMSGTPVTAGAVDTVAATVAAGAVNTGDMAITIGSSGRICCVSPEVISDRRLLNVHNALGGGNLIIQSVDNAGISLKWFRDTFGTALQTQAAALRVPVYQLIDEIAEKAGAGADGIIYLPYLTGEKSPIWDPHAKGVFFNIGIGCSLGSFARAVLEGVAYSVRDCYRLVSDRLPGTECIPMGGGAASSRLWCQIFADVLGHPVVQLVTSETETLGDMIIGASAMGIKEIPVDFGKKLAAKGTVLYPDAAHKTLYDEGFSRYCSVYDKIKDYFF